MLIDNTYKGAQAKKLTINRTLITADYINVPNSPALYFQKIEFHALASHDFIFFAEMV
jgi:hypothetical protein